jgi:hypothetical protein
MAVGGSSSGDGGGFGGGCLLSLRPALTGRRIISGCDWLCLDSDYFLHKTVMPTGSPKPSHLLLISQWHPLAPGAWATNR